MPSREATFGEVMNAWRAGASMFRAGVQLSVPLFTNAFESLSGDDKTSAVSVARFYDADLMFRPLGRPAERAVPVYVIYDTKTGYIVSSSHELEGYRMKDGQPDAPLGRVISDGSLVFERSEEARRFWALQLNDGGLSDRSA